MEELLQLVETLMGYDDRKFALMRKDIEKTIFDALLHSDDSDQAKSRQVEEFRSAGLSRNEVEAHMEQIKDSFNELFINLKANTENAEKKDFLDNLYKALCIYIDDVVDEYENFIPVVEFELCHPNAKLPQYAHPGDHGADIYAVETITVPAHTFGMLIPTGLKARIPTGWAIAIRPRSGMSRKTPLRISNSVATIDTDYRGEIGILFDNFSNEPVTIQQGDRIAQMILERNFHASFTQVETVDDNTERGEGGFGSSGK